MRHHVESRAVTYRRGVQQHITRRDRIHLAGKRVTRRRQRPMAEHGALRAAGGAGRVEQPSEVTAKAWVDRDRIGRKQGLVLGAADRDQILKRCRSMGRDLIAELAGCEAHAGAGMLQDIADLAAVQFCIGGHHDCSRVPMPNISSK